MRIILSLLVLVSLTLAGCSSTRTNSTADVQDLNSKKDVNETKVDVTSGVDLATYLRRLPGIIVRGSGSGTQIQVRGNSSFGTSSDPLFVVNGTILGTSYSSLLSTVDPADIASVKVLKNASETAAYGIQGGNGVLEFKLKK